MNCLTVLLLSHCFGVLVPLLNGIFNYFLFYMHCAAGFCKNYMHTDFQFIQFILPEFAGFLVFYELSVVL